MRFACRITPRWFAGASLVVLIALTLATPIRADWRQAIAQINAATSDNAERGSTADARQAWQAIAAAPAVELPQLLTALDEADLLAANWIRSAIDAVADKAAQRGEALPRAELEKYLAETSHNPRARRMAYELLAAANTDFAAKWLPGALDDPSLEIRRDAVALLLEQAQAAKSKDDKEAAIANFQTAFAAARDEDQIKLAADQLKELGKQVNVTQHYGFVTEWKLIGPFDNVAGKGFNVAYPPEVEQGVELTDVPGKNGSINFRDFTTDQEMGQVDLNAAIGKEMGAIAYAVAEFDCAKPQAADFRLGTPNANKIWANGKLVHEAEVYHALTKLDQYIARGELKPGRNVIVLKICQNEQTEQWAQDWTFQFRVCDETGGAILQKSTQ